MVTSRVSSCFSSSFFGSILSHGKGSLHSAHHFFEEIGSHTTFFYLLILQEGVKDCNVYHSLVFVQWQVLSMVVVTLVLSKIYKNLQEKRPCHIPPQYFINSWHFKHWASWNSPGIQYAPLFKCPFKTGQLNWWICFYLCKRSFWHPGYYKLTWSSVVWETE